MILRPNGAAIRVIRERTGISLSALAADAGIDKGQLSRIERGQRGGLVPSPATLRAIADRLSVTLDAITYPAPEPEREEVAS